MKNLLIILNLIFVQSLFGKVFGKEVIAVIDTGNNDNKYSCNTSLDKDFTNTSLKDTENHGTIVNKLITKGLDKNKYCTINIKYYDIHTYNEYENIKKSLTYLLKLFPIEYLNLSFGGLDKDRIEHNLLKKLRNKGTKIFVSAGNEGMVLTKNNCNYFPACYLDLNLFIVGGLDVNNKVFYFSNRGPVVNYWEIGYYKDSYGIRYGTSFASPRALRRWINEHP